MLDRHGWPPLVRLAEHSKTEGSSWVYRRRRGKLPPWQLSAPYFPISCKGILSLTDLSGSLAGHCSPRERTPGGVLTESHYEAAPLRIEIAQSCLSELARHPISQPDVCKTAADPSAACWLVRSLQVTSGGSSSQCARVGPSSAGRNDQRTLGPRSRSPPRSICWQRSPLWRRVS